VQFQKLELKNISEKDLQDLSVPSVGWHHLHEGAAACLTPLWGRPVIGSRISLSWPVRMCTYCLQSVTDGCMLFRHSGLRAAECASFLLVKPVFTRVLSLDFQPLPEGHWKVDAYTLAGQSVLEGKVLCGAADINEVRKLVEEHVQERWMMTEPELATLKLLHGNSTLPRQRGTLSSFLTSTTFSPKRSQICRRLAMRRHAAGVKPAKKKRARKTRRQP